MDKSLDGPRGLALLNDSFDGAPSPGKAPARRRHSNISNTSSAPEGAAGTEGGVDRGSNYLRSWLFVLRRCVNTYYFVMSFVLIFCFAIKVRRK